MARSQGIPRDGTVGEPRERIRQALASGDDDTNPEFLFSTTHTTLLQAIEVGLIDPGHLVHCELVRRGLAVNGAGCRAREIHPDAPAAGSAEPEADTAAQQAIAEIARKILHLDTIETRNSDALDFPGGLSVWQIKDALLGAFAAGQAAAR